MIRVYRERNRTGFIKAFSEEPEQIYGGNNKTERLLRTLYLKNIYLWPRFRVEVNDGLEKYVQSDVIELSLALDNNMKIIQSAILVALNTCIQEMKKSCPTVETSDWTLENGLFHAFDLKIRNQLDPEWHKVPFRSKQILNDMGVLRKLLDYLIRYDAFSFYYLLLKIQSASSEQQLPALW